MKEVPEFMKEVPELIDKVFVLDALAEAEFHKLHVTNIGQGIDVHEELKNLERRINALSDKVRTKRLNVERETLALMDEASTTRGGGSKAKGAINEDEFPQVEDWDELYKFIKRNNAFHLLERRVSRKAWREELQTREKPFPGISTYTKRSLSTSKL